VKGGHLSGPPVDLLFDGREFTELERPRIQTKHTHGTGCTYASAIATFLGGGASVPESVRLARDAVQRALEHALPLGHGQGPLDHRRLFEPDP
jgi:hydroxymethylpyrimidine/phosphomethylpyrimidine kinase